MEECQRRVDSRQFTEFKAAHDLRLWGSGREDLRAAIIASTVYNRMRAAEAEPLTAEDFMPTIGREAGEDPGDGADDLDRRIMAAMGA